jgi:superfamily I DNA/RNA helicase
MNYKPITIEELWAIKGFIPNDSQRDAILHIDGPLFLTAGPGSGKTRVLLWRTLNLIVFHNVKPEDIFLSTFTEKASLQLKDGLRTLLGIVSNVTGKPFDISKMSIGTVHSIFQKEELEKMHPSLWTHFHNTSKFTISVSGLNYGQLEILLMKKQHKMQSLNTLTVKI